MNDKKEQTPEVESLPQAIEIEKEGEETRFFNAITGKEIDGDITVKLDMSAGKPCKAKLTFEVHVKEIRVLEKQLSIFGKDREAYSVTLEVPTKKSRS